MTTCNVTTSNCDQVHIAFEGLTDAKGRKLGAWVTTSTRTAVENNTNSGYVIDPGVWFAVNMCGSRDGVSYGVTGGTKLFRTEDERAAYIAKRIKTMRSKAV